MLTSENMTAKQMSSKFQDTRECEYFPEGEKSYQPREWLRIIENIFLPVKIKLESTKGQTFVGCANSFTFGKVQISMIESTPITIYKQPSSSAQSEFINIYIPERDTIFFDGKGDLNHCAPGDFLFEIGDCLDSLSYTQNNRILIIKVPKKTLRNRTKLILIDHSLLVVRETAVVKMYLEFLKMCVGQRLFLSQEQSLKLSEQLIGMLSIALDDSECESVNAESSVKKAHLRRIFGYIQLNLCDSSITPQSISDSCGISVRYLHLLFKETNWSVSNWIRECRLRECYKILSNPSVSVTSMADLAYRFGFNDQATFNRCFKAKYNKTPKTVRQKAISNEDNTLCLATTF